MLELRTAVLYTPSNLLNVLTISMVVAFLSSAATVSLVNYRSSTANEVIL